MATGHFKWLLWEEKLTGPGQKSSPNVDVCKTGNMEHTILSLLEL